MRIVCCLLRVTIYHFVPLYIWQCVWHSISSEKSHQWGEQLLKILQRFVDDSFEAHTMFVNS